MSQYDAPPPPPPPRQGMSTSSKVLIGFGVGCGLLLVLCCGVIGIGGVWLANFAQKSLSEDPFDIVEATKEIAEIKIPDSLMPKAVFNLRVPFSGDPLMLWVSYEDESSRNHLVLGQFGPAFSNIDNFESELHDSIRQSGGRQDDEEIDVEESETYETKINDEDATFRIARGKGRKSEDDLWDVTGQFRGYGGPAMLLIRVHADDYTKEQVLDIIKSMED